VQFITIARHLNPAIASLAASRLEAAGFNVLRHGEGAAHATEGYSLAVGGIRLQVPESEAESARALLKDLEREGSDPE